MHKRISDAVRSSVIVNALLAFIRSIYRSFLRSPYGKSTKVYDKTALALDNSRLKKPQNEPSALRAAVARRFYNSKTSRLYSALEELLLRTTCQSYGMIIISCGCIAALFYFFRDRLSFVPISYDIGTLLPVFALCLPALVLLFFDKPLGTALTESRFFHFLLFELLSISPYRDESEKRGIPLGFSFLLGIFIGAFAVLASPLYVFSAILIVVLFLVIVKSPEFSLSLAVILIPFSGYIEDGTLFLVLTVLTGTFAYAIKLLMNKRTFALSPLDLPVFLFMILYLFGGIFSFGGRMSLLSGLAAVALLCSFFLAENLLSSETAFFRFCRLFSVVSFIVALFGIFSYLLGIAPHEWLDDSMFKDIPGRISVMFKNANILAVYLLFAAPVALSMAGARKKPSSRFGYFIVFLTIVTALVMTWSRGAWLGLFAALAVYCLLSGGASPIFVILFGALLPIVPYFLPEDVIQRFFSVFTPILSSGVTDSSISYRLQIWRGTAALLRDHWIGGIGVGNDAFTAVFPQNALSGSETAVHTHSLYLQLLTELGVMGGVCILLFAALLLFSVLSHKKLGRHDPMRTLHIGVFTALLGTLVMGLGDDIFYSPRLFCLFFLLAGVAAALSRLGHIRATERALAAHDEAYHAQAEITVKK